MKALALFLLLVSSFSALAQDFAIEDFQVRWVYMDVGNSSLRVMKDEDWTFINIYRSNGITSAALHMSGPNAMAVGEALARTREIYDAQLGATENVAETVSAGDLTVTFRTSPFNGFTVVIQDKSRFSSNAVTLPLEEAVGIQQHLLKGDELIAFLNDNVRF